MRIIANRAERRAKLRDWRWWVRTIIGASIGLALADFGSSILHALEGALWRN